MRRGTRTAPLNIEHLVSVLIGAAGIAVLVGAGNIRIPLTANVVDPRFFPKIVGGLLCIVAVVHAVAVFRGDLGVPDEGEDVDLSMPTDYKALAIVAASFIAHALLVDRVGWVPAAVVLFAGSAFGLGARKPIRVLIISVLLSVGAFVLFRKGLGVYLPDGPLFRWVS